MRGAAIVLSLYNQPDLVTEALFFGPKDISEAVGDSSVSPVQLTTTVKELARQAIQAATTQFPDSSQQPSRILAAKSYIETLMAEMEGPKIKASSEDPTDAGGDNQDAEVAARGIALIHGR
jgi:hypothetical protein